MARIDWLANTSLTDLITACSGMGINPTPASALSIWGPYVFTLLFLTFGMRGLEPLKRFLYDRQKRRKQVRWAVGRSVCLMS